MSASRATILALSQAWLAGVAGAALPGGAAPPKPPLESAYYDFLLGKIHRFDGQLASAAEHLALAANADDAPEIRIELAETYLRMGNLDQAIEQARLATEKAPQDFSAHRTLAEAYLAAVLRGPDKEASIGAAIGAYRALVSMAPSEVGPRLTLGRLLLQANRTEEAVEQFRILKLQGSDRAETGIMIARALLRSERPAEARAELEEVLVLDPVNSEALASLVQITEGSQDWIRAAEFQGRLAALHPSDAALGSRHGYLLVRAGRAEQAVTVLRETVQRSPADRFAREILVRALGSAGRPGEALRELAVLLEYRPGEPTLLLEVGRLHEARSEDAAALEAYRRAFDALDTSTSDAFGPELRSGLLLSIAALAIEVGEVEESIQTLDSLPDAGRGLQTEVLVLRCRALLAAGRAPQAHARARELVEIAPADPRAALLLLESRIASDPRRELIHEALKSFEAVVQGPQALGSAAEIVRRSGHPKPALALLRRLASERPRDAETAFVLGAHLERTGDHGGAERAMRRVLEIQPGNAQALNFLGYLLAERGRELPYAESLIRKALDVEPDSGAFLDSLGWALFRQGKVDEAERALTRAADLLAGDGTVREHLGDVYAAKGDQPRALAEWRVAQGLDPEDPERLRRKILGAGKAAARR